MSVYSNINIKTFYTINNVEEIDQGHEVTNYFGFQKLFKVSFIDATIVRLEI